MSLEMRNGEAPATLLLLWTAIILPVLSFLSYRRLKSGKPLAPPRKRFPATIVFFIYTGFIALFAASSNGMRLSLRFTARESYLGLFFLVLVVPLAFRSLRLRPDNAQRLFRFYGTTKPIDLALVLIVALFAGVIEEFTYRGVLYELLRDSTGSTAWAVAISSFLFTIAHLAAGPRRLPSIALFALLFHALAIRSGSLLVPIIVHTLYDAALFAMLYKRFAPPAELPQTLSQSA